MNLVVVSNRVSRGKPNEPMTGGLAAALLPIVEKSGAIWVGSSGRVRDGNQKEPFAEVEALGAGALAMLDLPAAHYGGYYEGFANSALWPALHYRLAPHAEKAIYAAVSLIRADLPNAPIEVLPGKCVCEIKHSGFTKASGVRELMTREPFKGRRPFFIGDDVTDESVFAIMPDLDGLAFSVGRRAKGVAGHFDAPSDVREFLTHLLDDERDASLP